jgi:outer membrane lipoprotein carrier protein
MGCCSLLTLIVALQAPAAASLATDNEATRLLSAVQERHRALSDLEARFVQTYRSGALGQEIVEHGLFRFKRPGMMRWEYRSPEKKLFLSDGQTVYFYVPEDHQVVVQDQAGLQGRAFRLLAGDVALTRDFESEIEKRVEGRVVLRLTPRQPDPEVETIVLEVDDQRRIRGIEVHDLQGAVNRFDFDHVKENRGLPRRLFQFEIPSGVEVVRG